MLSRSAVKAASRNLWLPVPAPAKMTTPPLSTPCGQIGQGIPGPNSRVGAHWGFTTLGLGSYKVRQAPHGRSGASRTEYGLRLGVIRPPFLQRGCIVKQRNADSLYMRFNAEKSIIFSSSCLRT